MKRNHHWKIITATNFGSSNSNTAFFCMHTFLDGFQFVNPSEHFAHLQPSYLDNFAVNVRFVLMKLPINQTSWLDKIRSSFLPVFKQTPFFVCQFGNQHIWFFFKFSKPLCYVHLVFCYISFSIILALSLNSIRK